MNIITRFGAAVKAAATTFVMSFGRTGTWGNWGSWGNWTWGAGDGLDADYARISNSGRSNSIVAATIGWICRKFPNGVLSMRKLLADGSKEAVPTHPFLALMRRPNPFYSGSTMLKSALADWTITGDAYLLKERNGLMAPVQLWYVPSFLIEPVSDDPNVFVEHYDYAPNGERKIKLRPEDVIHIRNGIDPNNVRKGLSPMAAVVREIFTDEEASVYTASMLKNQGIPSVIISPDLDEDIPPDAGEEISKSYTTRFTGANRGRPLVIRSKVKVTPLSFDPNKMDLSSVRNTAEERITAVLGVPAVVVGMGSGLDSATYSNLASLREVAIEDNLLPTYYDFAEQLHAQLLPDFEKNPDLFELFFDVSGIRELQPDMDKMVERESLKLRSGGITINEFRKNTGENPLDDGDVLLIPATMIPTPLDAIVPVALPVPTPIRAVASYDGDVEMKAVGVMQSIVRVRTRLQDREVRALAALLGKQRDAAVAATRDAMKGFDPSDGKGFANREVKAIDIGQMVNNLEAAFSSGMKSLLEGLHILTATNVHTVVGEWADVDLSISDALRQAYLKEAGVNVKGITSYTLDALSKTIRASVYAGESVEETIARVQGLHVFSDARAETIVKTELSIAANKASINAFKQSGIVTHVRVHDGTEHDEPCASLAGQVLTLDAAAGIPPVQHPRCVRSFEPLTKNEAQTADARSNGHVTEKELVAA